MLAEILPKVAGMEQEDWAYSPRPSSNDRCLRSLWYHATGAPRQPFPGRTILVFDDGHWHEELTGDWIQKTAYRLHSQQMEVNCYEVAGNIIKGHIDGIITDLVDVDRLWEHKAINHFTFERIWNGERPMGYIGQCCCYLKGLQELDHDIKEAVLLFKNKNTAQYIEILLSYDTDIDFCRLYKITRSTGEIREINEEYPRMIRNIVDKYEMVEHYKSAGKTPERPYTFAQSSDFPCSYCGWGETCWGGYIEAFEALEKDKALDEEMETLAGYYLEVKGQHAELEKERDELRAKLLKELEIRKVSGGRAGVYTIIASIVGRSSIDQSAIPPAILAQAKKTTHSPRLSVRKAKESA